MPIAQALSAVIMEGVDPTAEIQHLMNRKKNTELPNSILDIN